MRHLRAVLIVQQQRRCGRGSHTAAAAGGRRRRQQEEEESRRHVRVSVWWDLENCNVPAGTNVFRVSSAISAAVRANGIKGPVEITAFGDMIQLSRFNQEGLSSTGINLAHIPRGGKNSTDRSILLNLVNWVSQNPPPAHLFLISGDRDFASILHRLRMNNYNILLAIPYNAHGVLCSAASIMWNWYDLLRGENLAGKYFNQPPDGPYGSWYGHYKMPILDPFALDTAQPALLQSEESSKPNSEDDILRPVPEVIVKQIRQMVESNPNGISVTELRNELARNEKFDKEKYYGYRRFLPFLLSMDNLKLKRVSDGHYLVYGITQYGHDNEDVDVNGCSESGCDGTSSVDGNGKTPLSSPTNPNEKDRSRNTQKISPIGENMIEMGGTSDGRVSPIDERIVETLGDEKVVEVVQGDEKIAETDKAPESDHVFHPGDDEKIVEAANEPESSSTFPVVIQQESSSEPGFFKRIWRKWFGSEISSSDTKSCEGEIKSEGKDSEKDSNLTVGFVDSSPQSSLLSENTSSGPSFIEKDSKPTAGFVDPSSHSSPISENTGSESSFSEKVVTNPGILDRIRNWFRVTSDTDKPHDRSSDEADLIIRGSRHEIFSKDSFWSAMESFMDTPEGPLLVCKSKTREQMARDLQRKGPECLQSLEESDLLHLVHLLISEKKWVEECPSEAFPFILSRVGKSSAQEIHLHTNSNNLSSLFRSQSSQPGVRGPLPNRDENEKSEIVSRAVEEILPLRSRDEVLADCQNLVNEILKVNKSGFFVGLFRKHFLERYGYHLDFQKLGYPDLTALLSTMSGVKIKSGHMIPRNTAESENALSHSKNGYGLDSPWEELGPPVASPKSSINTKRASESEEEQNEFDYEPAISEDEFSDPDETHPINKKAGLDAKDSSLLQILDSWHGRKESDLCKNKSESAEAVSDLATDTVKSKSEDADGMLGLVVEFGKFSSKAASRNQGRKQMAKKNYSFVLDSGSDNKKRNKIANGELPNLSSSKNEKDKVLCQ